MKLKIIILTTAISLLSLQNASGFDYWQALPTAPIIPDDNPASTGRIFIGKLLYFDPLLSQDGSQTCNNCHNVFSDGADGRQKSIGFNNQVSKRNAPSVWNVAFQTVLSWDGKYKSLEEFLQSHLLDKAIMGIHDSAELIRRIDSMAQYHEMFSNEFSTPTGGVNLLDVAKSLAGYIRTLTTPNSPYDRYIKGDVSALTHDALRGKNLFQEIGCLACHFGVNLSGPAPGPGLKMGDGFYELFPNYKTSPYIRKYDLDKDLGVFELDHNPRHKSLWRVPTLRNIGVTAPYFHNGSVSTLSEAVKVMAETQLNISLEQQQVRDLVAFLHALTGQFALQFMPKLPIKPGQSKYTKD